MKRSSNKQLVILGIILAAAIFILDIELPLGVAAGVPYVALVLVALWHPQTKYIYFAAITGSVLTMLGFILSSSGGVMWMVILNRFLSLFVIWITAAVSLQRRKIEINLQKSREELKRRRDQIEDVNLKLVSEISEREKAEQEISILAKFPEENPNPVLRVSIDGLLQYANPASLDVINAWGVKVGERLPEFWDGPINVCLREGVCRDIELEIEDRIFNFMAASISKDEYVYLYGRDVTERRLYEEQLLLFESVFDNTVEGIVITDTDGMMENVNPAFSIITGYQREETIGNNPQMLQSDRHSGEFYEAMWASLLETGQWTGEVWNRRKNGEAYPQWLSITALKGSDNQTRHYVGVFHDITETKIREQEIKHYAEHDPLTGLPNRALFYDRLEMAISRAERNKEQFSVVFVDLDNFKDVNDSHGHIVGDMLLKEVADRLSNTIRDQDTVARIGGDEFIVILTEVEGESGVIKTADRMLAAVSKPFLINEIKLDVGISMGITMYPDHAIDAEILIKNADTAMYKAKEQGKNNYQFFTSGM